MGKMQVQFDISSEEFLANLTQAVYQVVLKAGFNIPFIKMELDLQSALCEVIEKDMLVFDDAQNLQQFFSSREIPHPKTLFPLMVIPIPLV